MNSILVKSKLRPSSSSLCMDGSKRESRDPNPTVSINDEVSTQSGYYSSSNSYKGTEEDNSHKNGSNIVYFVLMLSALVFGTATVLLLDAGAQREFESEFSSFARETVEIAENNADKMFGQLQAFATAITSIGVNEDNGNHFPNVTVPNFDLRT